MIVLPTLREVHYYNYILTFVLGVVLNFLLVLLIVARTSKELRAYRRILLVNTIFDLSFTFVVFCAGIQPEFDNGIVVFVISSFVRHLPESYQYLAISTDLAGLASVNVMLPVQYYYRFYLIAKGRPPSNKVLIRLLLIVAVSGTINGILCFLSFYSTSHRGIDYSYILDDPMWTESDGRLATFLAADITSWEMLTYFSYAMVLVVGSYVMALYYVVITYKAISNNARHFSEKTKRLQKQLSFTLFVQTVAPFFAISLPCLFIMLQAFFKLDMSGYGCLFSLPMFWIYVINPGSTIMLVGQYRTAVFCRRTSGAVHTSSNTPPHKGVI